MAFNLESLLKTSTHHTQHHTQNTRDVDFCYQITLTSSMLYKICDILKSKNETCLGMKKKILLIHFINKKLPIDEWQQSFLKPQLEVTSPCTEKTSFRCHSQNFTCIRDIEQSYHFRRRNTLLKNYIFHITAPVHATTN